jgi:hypothetical protein
MIVLAVTAEPYPLRIHPNFDGSSTTVGERRLGGVSPNSGHRQLKSQLAGSQIRPVGQPTSFRACASVLISYGATG